MIRRYVRSLREGLRQHAGKLIFDGSLHGIARLGRLHPHARPRHQGVEVLRDIPYRDSGDRIHTLDVYRPSTTGTGQDPLPAVLYIHGGGFRILSKDTHWVMGLAFARRGFVVFNINYRLAPRHPYPAALQDAADAYLFVSRHAREYGGDPTRLVLAGESAGANLVTSLSIAASYRRPEPFARAVFDCGVRPVAALPACGILQVSQTERFHERKAMPTWIADRLLEVTSSYLPWLKDGSAGPSHDLADPLVVLEQGLPPDRPLPPFFVPVGTRDPLLDDSRRLKAALDRLGVPCEAHYYPGEVHAFHALVWRDNAKRCWRDTFAFLNRHLPAPPSPA
jgi:acetyl esterase